MEHFALFDFDEARYLVKYTSDKEIGDEIEDAISSYDMTDDTEYEEMVADIMNSFNVKWEIVPYRKYWI